ncbi:unnamed protein product [Caenorhabditis brenneri]
MLRVIFIVLVFNVFYSHSLPNSKIVNLGEDKEIQCVVCQFMGVAMSAKIGKDRTKAVEHCLKYEGCERQRSDCEIIESLHSVLQKSPQHFESSQMITEAFEKCSSDSNAVIISEDPSSTQCMLCFLVYDVLKYINYNILDNPMLLTVKNAIGVACSLFLNEDLCKALFLPDAFSAIIRGLKDSLGGFYDLIAVQGFGCVPYPELFGACPGH